MVKCPSPLAPAKCYTSTDGSKWTAVDCGTIDSLTSVSTGCPQVATKGLNLNCSGGKNPIYALLEFAINWLIKLLLVLAVVAVVVSGIQYIVSQGNPDGIKAAKSRLTNAVVGLILLSLMFVILHVLGVS